MVRYRVGGPPLWCGRQDKEHRPQEPPAASDPGAGQHHVGLRCAHCGGPRQYEFQVQPQLLHFLTTGGGSGPSDALDWGALMCYTCAGNCSVEGGVPIFPGAETKCAYVEEFCWRQTGHELQPGRTVFD